MCFLLLQLSKIVKTLENFEDQTEDEDDDYQFGFLLSDKNDSDSQSVSSDDYVRSKLNYVY